MTRWPCGLGRAATLRYVMTAACLAARVSDRVAVALASILRLRLQTTARLALLGPEGAAGAGGAARCAEPGGEGGVAAAEAERERPGPLLCQGEPSSAMPCPPVM